MRLKHLLLTIAVIAMGVCIIPTYGKADVGLSKDKVTSLLDKGAAGNAVATYVQNISKDVDKQIAIAYIADAIRKQSGIAQLLNLATSVLRLTVSSVVSVISPVIGKTLEWSEVASKGYSVVEDYLQRNEAKIGVGVLRDYWNDRNIVFTVVYEEQSQTMTAVFYNKNPLSSYPPQDRMPFGRYLSENKCIYSFMLRIEAQVPPSPYQSASEVKFDFPLVPQDFSANACPSRLDTDRDGLDDLVELNDLGTDPTSRDTDGDGRNDDSDLSPLKPTVSSENCKVTKDLTLRIDGSKASARPQKDTFRYTGSNYCRGSEITRYIQPLMGETEPIDGNPKRYNNGKSIKWSYTPPCSQETGVYTLWVEEESENTTRKSNTVTQVILESPQCETTQSSAPRITSVGMPDSVQVGETTEWEVGFSDPDGDVTRIEFQVREGSEWKQTGSWNPNVSGQEQGVIAVETTCSEAGAFQKRVRLQDTAGNTSQPHEYTLQCISSDTGSPPASRELNVVDTTIARDVEEDSPYEPIERTQEFTTDDKEVYVWFKAEEGEGTHSARFEWYRPNGTLHETDNLSSFGSEGQWDSWWKVWDDMPIAGHEAASFTGSWAVKVYIDGEFYFKETFSIQRPTHGFEANTSFNLDNVESQNTTSATLFHVQGKKLESVRVSIYSLSGNEIFSGTATGSTLKWTWETSQRPVATGVYLYQVTAKGPNGQIKRSKIRKLMVMR